MLYNLMETLRLLAMVIGPVMPQTATKMAAGLGLDGDDPIVTNIDAGGKWGALPSGTVTEKMEPLFPRVDVKKEKTEKKKQEKKQTRKKESDEGGITFEQFKQVDLRVAEIVSAKKVEKSDRLLLLTVKAKKECTIVAGIAEHYSPDDLIGLQVIMVANLKPAKIMGLRSEGMLLAAKTSDDDGERLVLTTVSGAVKNGSKVA